MTDADRMRERVASAVGRWKGGRLKGMDLSGLLPSTLEELDAWTNNPLTERSALHQLMKSDNKHTYRAFTVAEDAIHANVRRMHARREAGLDPFEMRATRLKGKAQNFFGDPGTTLNAKLGSWEDRHDFPASGAQLIAGQLGESPLYRETGYGWLGEGPLPHRGERREVEQQSQRERRDAGLPKSVTQEEHAERRRGSLRSTEVLRQERGGRGTTLLAGRSYRGQAAEESERRARARQTEAARGAEESRLGRGAAATGVKTGRGNVAKTATGMRPKRKSRANRLTSGLGSPARGAQLLG